jgi:hypothetical protein
LINRTEKSLRALERKHGVRKRWELEDAAASNAKARLLQKKRTDLLIKLHRLACERLFVLEMKKKYSGNHSFISKNSRVCPSACPRRITVLRECTCATLMIENGKQSGMPFF